MGKYYVSNAYTTDVFDPEEDLYKGIDGNIYIGSCESSVYGTSKAAEGYDEEPVSDFKDIEEYFRGFDSICQKTGQCDYKDVDRTLFFSMLREKYNEIIKEREDLE